MTVIKHPGKKPDLGRIYGGIAWPGEKAGFVVVVGENRLPEVGTDIHLCYLLAEAEAPNTPELLRKCAELGARFNVERFYGRDDKSNMRYLYDVWNKEARARGFPELRVYVASFSEEGNIGYHINILHGRLLGTNKSLFLGEDSQLPGYLREADPRDQSTITESQFPAIAALGYAVTGLTLFKPILEDEDDYDYKWERARETGNRATGY